MRAIQSNAFHVLSLLFLIYLFDFADRKIMSALFPLIKEEWNLSDLQLSMLGGIISLMTAIFVIPMTILVDRWSRKKMIALMTFLWSIMTLLSAFAENYTQMLIYRAMIGIGEAAYGPAAISMISKFFPRTHRGKFIGIYDTGAPLGIALGLILGGYIGSIYGWRHALGLVAIPGILLAILFLFIKDYPTIPVYVQKQKSKFSMKHIYQILGTPTLWYIFFAFTCMTGINSCILDWAPSFFMRVHHLSHTDASIISAIIAASVIAGAPLGGIVSDKLQQRTPYGRIIVSAVSTLGAGICLAIAVSVSHSVISYIFFILFGFQTIAFFAPASAIIQDIVQPGVRTLAFGINILIMNILGAFAMILLVGKISDIYGIQVALQTLPIFAIAAAIFFVLSKKTYIRDSKKISSIINKQEYA